jgi:subtilase family serine protease
MQPRAARFALFVAVCVLLTIPALVSAQQTSSMGPLIVQPVDETNLTALKGNTHPLARLQFDQGAAPPSLPMERMLLVLKRSPEQEAALQKVLDDQQDKASPNYHKWLTPDEFGQQFGPADQDIQIVTAWLQSHGLQVARVSRGRTVIEFSGTAAQVQEALHTSIHKYVVNGEDHWANTNDPQIPAALVPVVAGVHTLHNFLRKPQIHIAKQPVAAKFNPGPPPQVTFPAQNGQPALHALGPQDYAKIYNISSGMDGSGKTIAVVGRSNISLQDVADFRKAFGLGGSYPNVIVDGPDPGISPDLGEQGEATLDTTWSGAIAANATIDLVVSASTNTTDGVDLSEVYIIDNNLADVMSESFGTCEFFATAGDAAGVKALAQQAAAQGITYMVSTGDTGSAGCDNLSETMAQYPVSVNLLASSPFTVAVGGTMFNEHGQDSKYWGSALPLAETALSYIPENVWNESCTVAQCGSQNANIAAGGGGASTLFSKPSWQSGVSGIPPDGVRDLPDVSLTAAFHDPYLLCLQSSCEQNFIFLAAGTSASAPSFAGIMALVDQKTGSRHGQANYVLYKLAAKETLSQCNGSNTSVPPASTCVFNDVTVGNNSVPGETGYPNGKYPAGVGYDLATGLGSMNVTNLVNNWNSVTFNPTTTTLQLSPTTNITHGQSVNVAVSVAPNSGGGTPSGDVSLIASTGQSATGESVTLFTLSAGSVSSTTNLLPGGTYNLTAHYAGDATFAPSDSPSVTVTISPEGSTTAATVLAFDPNSNSIPLASVPYGSFVYLRADVSGKSGAGTATGTVNFMDNGGFFISEPLNSEGNTATPSGIFTFTVGQHSMAADYIGDASFNASNSPAVSFTIIKASTTTAITSSSSSVGQSTPVTLQANVSTNSFGNAPGGTATFFSGAAQLGSVPVTPGGVSSGIRVVSSATLTTTLPVGQDSITAQYSGDANYTASTAPAIAVNVQADFSVPPTLAAVTIGHPGGLGTTMLTITGQTGYNGTINFTAGSCAGLPFESHCSFNPASVTGSGTTTVTIATTPPSAAALNGFGWFTTSLGGALGVFLLGVPSKWRRWSTLPSLTVLALLVMGLGCGGGGSSGGGGGNHDPGTPLGTYSVTVTATSGVLTHSTSFTLTVQ